MAEKLTPQELRLEKLEPKHIQLLDRFTTSNKELKDFLVEDALRNQEIAISTTYLWFYRKTNELVAYVSLLADSLRIGKTELEQIFVEKSVLYKSLPALKIGRLCVDDRFAGRGIGTIITKFSMITAIQLNETVGCRFLVLDAKKESVSFYQKLGFDILKEDKRETVPMYYDLLHLIQSYKEGN